MRTLFAFVFLAFAAASPASADQIWLTMDQVRPYKIEKPAGQIVVGNPAIADVTVHDKQNIFLFGKAPGLTNMFVLDDDGNPVSNIVIRVQSADAGMVTLQRGAFRSSIICAERCDETMAVGDNTKRFSEVQQQVTSKAQQAKQSAE